METRQGGGLVVVGADVEDLQRPALDEREGSEGRDGQTGLLASSPLKAVRDVLGGDGVGQRDHHGPVPGVLVPSGEDGVVGTRPQPFERADDEVVTGTRSESRADRVGARVQGLNGRRVGGRRVGVAVPVDGQIEHLRDVDLGEVLRSRLVQVLAILLEINPHDVLYVLSFLEFSRLSRTATSARVASSIDPSRRERVHTRSAS